MPDYTVPNEFDQKLTTMVDSGSNPAKTKSEVISRAVALYDYLHKQVERPGFKVAIIDSNGTVVQVIDPLP